jgi:hypothetical protein
MLFGILCTHNLTLLYVLSMEDFISPEWFEHDVHGEPAMHKQPESYLD